MLGNLKSYLIALALQLRSPLEVWPIVASFRGTNSMCGVLQEFMTVSPLEQAVRSPPG